MATPGTLDTGTSLRARLSFRNTILAVATAATLVGGTLAGAHQAGFQRVGVPPGQAMPLAVAGQIDPQPILPSDPQAMTEPPMPATAAVSQSQDPQAGATETTQPVDQPAAPNMPDQNAQAETPAAVQVTLGADPSSPVQRIAGSLPVVATTSAPPSQRITSRIGQTGGQVSTQPAGTIAASPAQTVAIDPVPITQTEPQAAAATTTVGASPQPLRLATGGSTTSMPPTSTPAQNSTPAAAQATAPAAASTAPASASARAASTGATSQAGSSATAAKQPTPAPVPVVRGVTVGPLPSPGISYPTPSPTAPMQPSDMPRRGPDGRTPPTVPAG
jgi:hypothetical protein